ncbi:O-antigen ligase family protein [Bradyrhizobium erythrophlei]|uniref:O-Antigen ligase n=1 Tax=Bradyrhizobium erythrophlei TaxID=1437360 RepID=A0A1M5QTD5_9BRAD|nr:O-antigen ligase family protein [Bradyrhizobium erythrophlei]SHH17228.1 O-Antigen ligase [Bradyrhizobium erythrophlei]
MSRVFDRYFFFALVVSTVPILVLYNGLAGSHGNSIVTGLFIVSSLVAVALFSQWRRFVPNLCDVAFVAYVGCIAISFWLNGVADIKQTALLILTLAAYPAARLFAGTGLKPTFVFVTVAIVAAGSAVTAFELVRQWDSAYEKPMIFGMFAAGGNFLISLGIAMIAVTCLEMSARQRISATLLIIPAAAIFAASMVRLAFVAILVSLALGAYLSAPRIRRQIAAVILVTILAIATGLFVRSDKTMIMAGYAANGIKTIVASAAPDDFAAVVPVGEKRKLLSCSTRINLVDTIDVRLGLLRDAITLLKSSDWFGIGLDGFMKRSCIPAAEVHNSFLQAAIEFGWLGGIALLALVCLSGFYLLPLARSDTEARFAVCSLVCITILTIGSGRTSNDGLLFLFLGFAAGLHNLKPGNSPIGRLASSALSERGW